LGLLALTFFVLTTLHLKLADLPDRIGRTRGWLGAVGCILWFISFA